jgi:hypothetical protein
MKLVHILAAVLAFGVTCSSAMAATISYTEGKRPTVLGTTDINSDASDTAPGFDLGGGVNLGLGATDASQINLFGHIANRADHYQFNATSAFTISFNFGGYSTMAGPVAQSGFIQKGADSNTSMFGLTGAPSVSFTTNLFAGPSLIFTAGPGSYIFSIDGFGGHALYDLQFTALNNIAIVPLPMSGMMLVLGLGGFGYMRRKKTAA